MAMLDGLIGYGPGRAGNSANRDRRADLCDSVRPPAPACLQIAAILRGSHRGPSRRTGDSPRGKAGSRPSRLMGNFVVMVFRAAMPRIGWGSDY